MTPKERVEAVIHGELPDRLPVFADMTQNTRQVLGYSTLEISKDPAKAVEAMIAAQSIYGYDGMHCIASRKMILKYFGCKVIRPSDGFPYVEEPGIKDYSELKKIRTLELNKLDYLAYFLEVIKLLRKKAGNTFSIWGSTFGPFSLAGEARGMQNFLRDLYKRPADARDLLQITTDFSIEFGRECLKTGVTIFYITDPMASCSVISPRLFEQFALPCFTRLTQKLSDMGAEHFILHICGNTAPVLEKVADIPEVRGLSIDSMMDLAEAKRRVGDRVVILGNVNPVETMYRGTVEDVKREVIECIKKAAWNGNYILSPGCILPPGTTPENVHALVETAREFGKYPLNF